MEFLLKIKDYLRETGQIFWESLAQKYWSAYYGWLTEKLANQNPFMVLTLATSFALFFFLVFYWVKNR